MALSTCSAWAPELLNMYCSMCHRAPRLPVHGWTCEEEGRQGISTCAADSSWCGASSLVMLSHTKIPDSWLAC